MLCADSWLTLLCECDVTLSVAAACALAQRRTRVAGMVLLDPVDATPQDPESVLDSLKRLRGVPILIVGGGADDGGCSPGACPGFGFLIISTCPACFIESVGIEL